jgi:FAD/FMN-containing dehydrogenase
VAYVPEHVPEEWPPLAERVRAAFDPDGVLV